MAKYSSPDLVVKVATVDLSAYIKTIGGFAPSAKVADTTAFGAAWETFQSHLKAGGTLTLEGNYDDTATTGPDAKLNAIGTTVALEIDWGGTSSGKPKTTCSTIITKYERKAGVGGLTDFIATLQVSGAVTEGTN